MRPVIFATTAAIALAACQHAPPKAPHADVTITIGHDAIAWNGEPISRDEFERRLDAAAAAHPRPVVAIAPASDAQYIDVGMAMEAVRKRHLGSDKLGIIGGSSLAVVPILGWYCAACHASIGEGLT